MIQPHPGGPVRPEAVGKGASQLPPPPKSEGHGVGSRARQRERGPWAPPVLLGPKSGCEAEAQQPSKALRRGSEHPSSPTSEGTTASV